MFAFTPKNFKYLKSFRIKFSRQKVEFRCCKLVFGTLGLKALETGILTREHLKALNAFILKILKKLNPHAKYVFRMFPHTPLSKKALEVRMGKGKGAIETMGCRILAGRILVEFIGVNEDQLKTIFKGVNAKLPIKTKCIFRTFQ
jgi:large subunit ribosomal protein L16